MSRSVRGQGGERVCPSWRTQTTPRPGVSKGGPLKNCEGFHVAEAQAVKGSGGGKREGAGGLDSVRGVSGARVAGAG